MRICLWHGWLLDGTGSNVYMARTAEALRQAGHDVLLLCQDRYPERFGFVDAWGTVGTDVSGLIHTNVRHAASGGRVVVHDHVLQADGAGPRAGTLFALNMLVNTDRGANFTEDQYGTWMTAAGLVDVRRVSLPGPLQLMIGRKP